MLKVANRQEEGWLRTEDAEKFACKELRSIDQWWFVPFFNWLHPRQ
ncbi:GUN4-like protein [Raphidiopsis brookii D9]|nr:GUN4-like protein [Raphidiopsis brookii D9]